MPVNSPSGVLKESEQQEEAVGGPLTAAPDSSAETEAVEAVNEQPDTAAAVSPEPSEVGWLRLLALTAVALALLVAVTAAYRSGLRGPVLTVHGAAVVDSVPAAGDAPITDGGQEAGEPNGSPAEPEDGGENDEPDGGTVVTNAEGVEQDATATADSPEASESVAEVPAADAVSQTPESFLVFQGRLVPIAAGVEKCRFQPGDFVWEGDRLRYTGTDYDAVFGIDVSAYHNREREDGTLDWQAAKADGVSFAMVRAAYRGTTEGALYEDPYYAQNITGALDAGIQTGVYIFSQAVTVAEAVEEAEFLLDRIRDFPIDGPVCYDWEIHDRSNRTYGTSQETATACAAAFCQKIAEAGYTPLIYESKEVGYLRYDQTVLAPYARWYPQYVDKGTSAPCPDYSYHMDLWQFSDRCSVAGIGKRTDGSLWFRPREETP